MAKAKKPNRQIAHFEDGELWCIADAIPPVSPSGWYFRLHGTPVGWIGPFPTPEAAMVAPLGSDPVTAARRWLDEWIHAKAASRTEPPAEADLVVATVDGSFNGRHSPVHLAAARSAPSDSRKQSDASRNVGSDGEHDDNWARRVRPAGRYGPDMDARLDSAGVTMAKRSASSTCDEALAPIAPSTLALVPDPLPVEPNQVAAGGAGPASEHMQKLMEPSLAPRQLAFGFGQSAEAAISDPSETQLPIGPRRPYRRRKIKLVEQEMLPFQESSSGLTGGE